MGIIVFMLLVSLALGIGFLFAFLWANKTKQFDDLVAPAWRAIIDDSKKDNSESKIGDKNAR